MVAIRRTLFIAGAFALLAACAGSVPPPISPPASLVGALRDRASDGCNAATAAALASRGISAGDIAWAFYVPLISSGENARRVGSQAWIGLAGQPGSVVVDHNRGCEVARIYARDGARLPR